MKRVGRENNDIESKLSVEKNYVQTKIKRGGVRTRHLLNARIGNGAHGFSLATPANLKNGQPHQIRVRIVSTMSDINGSPKTVTCATPRYAISGTISYGQAATLVSGVSLNVTGSANTSAISNNSGAYQLSNLAAGSYVVTPAKTGNINGITPFDATLVLRCVAAGTGCTLTDNQKIAANTNGDNLITSFDATLILRYVAAGAQNANTGQVGNWKFNPESRSYNLLSASFSNQNYDAILIGEINGDWNPAASLAETNTDQAESKLLESEISKTDSSDGINNEAEISLPDNIEQSENGFVRIPVRFQNKTAKQISAYRFTVRFNPSILQPDESGFEKADGQNDGFAIVSDTATPGKIGIVGAASLGNNALKTVTLLYLRFRIVKIKPDSPRKQASATRLIFDESAQNAVMFEDDSGSKVKVVTSNGVFRAN